MFMQGTLCAGGIYGSVNEAFTLHSVLLKRQYWPKRQTETFVSHNEYRH